MSHLNEMIDDIVCGDDYELPRTVVVSDILPDTLAKAWLTIKRRLVDTDAQAVIQKSITPVETSSGQIDLIGSESPAQDAHLFFNLLADETSLLDPSFLYYYNIKGKSSGGAKKVLEGGRLQVNAAVTRAES